MRASQIPALFFNNTVLKPLTGNIFETSLIQKVRLLHNTCHSYRQMHQQNLAQLIDYNMVSCGFSAVTKKNGKIMIWPQEITQLHSLAIRLHIKVGHICLILLTFFIVTSLKFSSTTGSLYTAFYNCQYQSQQIYVYTVYLYILSTTVITIFGFLSCSQYYSFDGSNTKHKNYSFLYMSSYWGATSHHHLAF